ncbi:MAG: nucleotidyltransferase domain-containing protein [Candidatus Bathyarchaeia archaeon]
MAEKPIRLREVLEVVYSAERWDILRKLRLQAIQLLEALESFSIRGFIHGSVARGDVDEDSDIDVVVLQPIPSHVIETRLLMRGFNIFSRVLTQATPSNTPKAHIYLDPREKISVTFPLLSFKSRELEFYRFGGMLGLRGLRENMRVPGCTKRLTFIKPTNTGHLEYPVEGFESEVARELGISVAVVEERVRVLKRRDEHGRTGLFVKRLLTEGENFESVLEEIVSKNPPARRRLKF